MNAFGSRSGIFFLMNSSREGRINSAIIPLFGDFDLLQTWQTTGAVLIGIRCRIKSLLHRLVDSGFNLLEHATTSSHLLTWKKRKSLSNICTNKHTKRRNTVARAGSHGSP